MEILMECSKIVLVSLLSFIILFFLSKIIGNRQISQLTLLDYIISITIGSIAAEMSTDITKDWYQPLISMIVFALASIAISYLTNKSIKFRRFFTGETLILFDNGKIYKQNLQKGKLDLSEFLCQCRNQGVFNLEDIETAILEPNGNISILPKSTKRPVNPQDLNITPHREKPVTNIIMDGKVLADNLKYTGNDEQWLRKELKKLNISKISEVFLATCDVDNQLSAYIKITKPMTRDMFE